MKRIKKKKDAGKPHGLVAPSIARIATACAVKQVSRTMPIGRRLPAA